MELRKSVEEVKEHANGDIWLLGDFNFPKLVWPETNPILKSDYSYKQVYELFLDFLDDQLYPNDHWSDTTKQCLGSISNCKPHPGAAGKLPTWSYIVTISSDHDMVIAICCIKPSVLKQTSRKVQIFRKADWSKLKSLMADFRDRFINEHFGKSV